MILNSEAGSAEFELGDKDCSVILDSLIVEKYPASYYLEFKGRPIDENDDITFAIESKINKSTTEFVKNLKDTLVKEGFDSSSSEIRDSIVESFSNGISD